MKTRLIEALGERGAAQLASAMLRDVWATVSSVGGARPVWATDRRGDFPVPLADEDIWLQGDGDLGARIERILIRALQRASAALAIGADSPTIGRTQLMEATELLDRCDAVIGRARDGGFYLLGLRRCWPGLLAGLPWSCAQTAEVLKERLQERGLTVGEIAAGFDVDTPADLRLLTEELARNPDTAPETRAWLSREAHSRGSSDAH